MPNTAHCAAWTGLIFLSHVGNTVEHPSRSWSSVCWSSVLDWWSLLDLWICGLFVSDTQPLYLRREVRLATCPRMAFGTVYGGCFFFFEWARECTSGPCPVKENLKHPLVKVIRLELCSSARAAAGAFQRLFGVRVHGSVSHSRISSLKFKLCGRAWEGLLLLTCARVLTMTTTMIATADCVHFRRTRS